MLGDWGSKLIVAGWCAFLGAFTFLAYTDFAIVTNAEWCGGQDKHCLREWISATSGWAATIVAGITIFLLVRQINDAAKSVDIASETLNDNRLSAERQQRAYVYAGQTSFEVVGNTATITLEITNHGQTPARDVSVRRFAYIGKVDDLRDFPPNRDASLMGDLAPTQTRYSRTWPPANDFAKYENKIKNVELRIHIYVNITYIDVFNMKRETRFRLYNPQGKTEGFMFLNERVKST